MLASPLLKAPCRKFVFLLLLGPTLAPVLAQTDLGRAKALLRDGKLEAAEALLMQIGEGDPNYLEARRHLGTILYSTGRPVEAEKCFQDYIRRRKTAEVYTLLAGAQFNQKKLDQAYESAKQAVRLDPKYAKAYTAIGMIYTELKDWPDADAAFRESLRLDDKDASTWFLLGRSYFLRNEFGKAREAFETSLTLNSQSVRAYENLGLTLDLLRDPAAAERAFAQGVNLNRYSARPETRIHIAYGEFLFRQSRFEESQNQLAEATRIDPQNGEARYELARVLTRRKHWKEAAREAEEALRVGGPDYRVHFLLARIYTALGATDQAASHSAQAARLAEK
jgi:tetratricopeptide (TPR) repeat protein